MSARPPPPPPPRPSGTSQPAASALRTSALRPSARARLGPVAAVAAPPPPREAASTDEPSAEDSLNATRVGNHFISQVTPSNSPSDAEDGHSLTRAPATADAAPPVAKADKRQEAAPAAPAAPPAAKPDSKTAAAPAAEAPTAPAPSTPTKTTAVIGEKDVLGFGLQPNVLQLPSPVYLAQWVDDTHILLGAGGGGRRFGMINVLVLLKIDTTVSQAAPTKRTADAKAALADADARRMTRFVCAIEVGDDIPWCTSRFLPYDPAEAALDDTLADQVAKHCPHVVGFFAVSSITCFYLVALCRRTPESQYTLHLLSRIVVPNDDRNPDKKPIDLVHNALVVAHDDAGVLVYRLSSLLPPLSAPAAASGAPPLVEAAVPMASWKLPARANDVHANRINLVCAKKSSKAKGAASCTVDTAAANGRTPSRPRAGEGGGDGGTTPRFVMHSPSPARNTRGTEGGQSPAGHAAEPSPTGACRALLLNYVVVVAAVQDKTVRLGTLRLRRSGHAEEPATVTDQTALTGTDMGLVTPLMGSSLRLVRLFGLEDLPPSGQSLARRALVLRDLGELPVKGPSTPLASLLIVVFSMADNQSYFVRASLEASLERGRRTEKTDKPESRHGALRLCARVTEKPSPLVRDSITCLSAVAPPREEGAGPTAAVNAENLFGAAIPREWLVGSVEGWVARVQAASTPAEPPFLVTALRPSRDKGEAKRFPAVHTEPVSCVAVSPTGVDVITTDIVQKVVITTLPSPVLAGAAVSAKSPPAVPAHRTDIRLFPSEDDGDSIWSLLADFSTKEWTLLSVLLSLIAILLAMMLS